MKKCNTELMKELKVIQEEIVQLRQQEVNACTVTFTEREKNNLECRYDYEQAQQKIHELQGKERTIKHLLAVSNATVIIEGFGMTISEGLVYLAQLSANKKALSRLASKEALVRESSHYRSEIEFTKPCYDLTVVQKDVALLNKKIAQLQMALDRTNLTNLIDVS